MTPQWLSLAGKRALVTGCGSQTGIGFACAMALLELGAEVAVTATGKHIHDRVSELAPLGVVKGYVCDLTDPDATNSMFELISHDLGGIDIVINNAGMASLNTPVGAESGSLGTIDLTIFDQAISRNLMTTVHVTRAAIPHMQANGWGRINSISSVTARSCQCTVRVLMPPQKLRWLV